ncbi:MAG: flagellar biosynthesis protein FlhA [Elusimicrobia bacterium]|nr:flagellar biosynthesis protein FlhA [Elusimicrobiota bacterium]
MAETAPSQGRIRLWDLLGAIGLLGVLGMMIVPLPPWAVSVLVVTNLALSVMVLLVVMGIKDILEFSIFPSVLLGLTLFRLALNLATTKLILLSGNPGDVIEAFGKVVVRGDAVVGFVVFLILVIVQFLVITKGSERVSEVAARFTLDAMPGKQMAVDAEMNAGLIDEKQARTRRESIQREADFYGAMDGASKFVRGDAVAGLVVVAVNIVGGVIIGMARRNMDIVDVLRTYTVLTIGDGLAHQIPALVVSTAAGILVTRSATRAPVGQEWARQLSANPRSIAMAGGTMGILGFTGVLTGLPVIPFVLVGAGLGVLAYAAARATAAPVAVTTPRKAETPKTGPEDMTSLLAVEPLELELGFGLLFLVEGAEGDLLDRVGHIRRRLARDLGIVVPPLRIRDSSLLPPNTYALKIRGLEVARGDLMPGHALALADAQEGRNLATLLRGVPAKEPAFGLPALWVPDTERRKASQEGITVVDNGAVLATHLTELLLDHAHEILSRQDLQSLLNDLKARGQAVIVDELIPALLPLSTVHRVLQNLLSERVSVRNLSIILEALAEAATLSKDPDLLTEYARAALSRQISSHYRDAEGVLWCATLSPVVERRLQESLVRSERGSRLVLDPSFSDELVRSISLRLAAPAGGTERPVLLCAAGLRPYLKRHFERFLPRLVVLSPNEVTADTRVKSLGVIDAATRVAAGA